MNIDFEKMNGLVPAVVQSALNGRVLMLGYMNEEALKQTQETGLVTFWSRSGACGKKGETSGNTLVVQKICSDCDEDAILIQALPQGPTCHTGTDSCFEVGALVFFRSFLESLKRVGNRCLKVLTPPVCLKRDFQRSTQR